jgi:hypothetical protein
MKDHVRRRSRWLIAALFALGMLGDGAPLQARGFEGPVEIVCTWIFGLPVCFDICEVNPFACRR